MEKLKPTGDAFRDRLVAARLQARNDSNVTTERPDVVDRHLKKLAYISKCLEEQ